MLTVRNAKAFAVLAILYDLYGDDAKWLIVEPMLNGRECGFKVYRTSRRQAAFCEARGTDNISVYKGGSTQFYMGGNVPTQSVYADRDEFGADQYYQAAVSIQEYLDNDDQE